MPTVAQGHRVGDGKSMERMKDFSIMSPSPMLCSVINLSTKTGLKPGALSMIIFTNKCKKLGKVQAALSTICPIITT